MDASQWLYAINDLEVQVPRDNGVKCLMRLISDSQNAEACLCVRVKCQTKNGNYPVVLIMKNVNTRKERLMYPILAVKMKAGPASRGYLIPWLVAPSSSEPVSQV